jgi:hypothetical protein
MLLIEDGRLALSQEFVTCNGETKPIGEEGRQWWVDTCEIHKYEYSFSNAEYTDEVLKRFEEIKNFDPKYIYMLEMYVQDGFVSPEIELLMENIKLKGLLSDLTEVVLMGGM